MPSYGPEVLGPPARQADQQHWDPEMQTMAPEQRRELQLERLRTLVDRSLGGAAASVVKAKIAPMILAPLKLDGNAYAANAVPILAGLFLPMVGGGSRIVNGLANGMIAAGAAGIVDEILAKVGTGTPATPAGGEAGVGSVFMNGVGGDQTLMGNADYDSYSSNSSDDTSADAGEMNF